MPALPRGVRLKNPLNIEHDGTQWEGAAVIQSDPVFVEYKSVPFGFRAGFRNLISYVDRHGLTTVRGIISRHSPAGGDNITASDPDGSKQLDGYISAVCKRTGFAPDEQLAPKTWGDGSKLIYAMTEHEQGSFDAYFTSQQMAEGAFRAGIVDAPKPLVSKLGSTAASVGSAAAGAAAAIQPTVEAASNAQHSPNVRAFLVVLCIVLSVVAAIVRPKVKTEG
jgi:hypothetical protein